MTGFLRRGGACPQGMSSARPHGHGRACHSRALDVIFWITVASVVAIGLSLTGQLDGEPGALGVISFLVLAYVTFTACRASFAQARVDEAEIDNAHALIRQCLATVGMVDLALRIPDRERASALLDHLYGRVGLLVTQYGRYMRPEAADIVWEMENSIVNARFLRDGDLRPFVGLLRGRLYALQASVLDRDDYTLRALRGKK